MVKLVNEYNMELNNFFCGLIIILLGCGSLSIDKEKSEIDSNLTAFTNDNDSKKREEYCYIVNVVSSRDTVFVDADYIQYLKGQKAIDAAKRNGDADTTIKNGKIKISLPNDYYIVNENKKIRRLRLSQKITFELIINP